MLTEFDVVTGGRIWRLDKAQQDIVLTTLGTLPVDSVEFGTNDLSQARAVELLGIAGYSLKSPMQLSIEADEATRAPMPSDREATQVAEDQQTVAELQMQMKLLRLDFEDLLAERRDLKAASLGVV